MKRTGFIIAVVALLLATSSPGQKSGKGRYAGRRVELKKDARKNGYSTASRGTEIYFEANDVEDPTTGELLEGVKKLLFKCRPEDALIEQPLLFSRGKSQKQKIQCLILITPVVLIQDEPESN